MHSFARALLGSSAESATPDHDELSLLVGLCDQELILQLLEETVECLHAALQHTLRAHSTNDDAFATDTGQFLQKYVRVVVDSQSSELSNTDGKELSLETASRLLKFWKMVFSTETWKSYSADVLGPVLERLPAPLLAIAGLRRENLAISALSVMGHMLHTSSRFLTIDSSEVYTAACPTTYGFVGLTS